MTSRARPVRRFVFIVAAAAVGLAACSGAAAPTSPTPSADPTPSPSPSPSADVGSGGGSSGGSTGSGVAIINPTPVDPAAGQPRLIVPRPGQLNPHPVGAISLQASVDGRHVLVKVSWYSGVEPCNVLDSVKVERSGTDIAITLIEGASQLDVACIEIAELKATIVDLGDLEPGTYTIGAPNSAAPPIQVTIS